MLLGKATMTAYREYTRVYTYILHSHDGEMHCSWYKSSLRSDATLSLDKGRLVRTIVKRAYASCITQCGSACLAMHNHNEIRLALAIMRCSANVT